MELRPGDPELIALANKLGCSIFCFKCAGQYESATNPHIVSREAFKEITPAGVVVMREHRLITLDDVILFFRPVPYLIERLWVPQGEEDSHYRVNHLRRLSKEALGRVVGLSMSAYIWQLPFAYNWEADAIHHVLNALNK